MMKRNVVIPLLAIAIILTGCGNVTAYNSPAATKARIKADVKPTAQPVPTPEPWEPDAADVELIARVIYAEARGCSRMHQAAVAWCILNRVDAWGGTVHSIATAPNQFAVGKTATDTQRELARDVLIRWHRECQGEDDVGRVLPAGYLYFEGNGSVNIYRTQYRGGSYWDWSLPDIYGED